MRLILPFPQHFLIANGGCNDRTPSGWLGDVSMANRNERRKGTRVKGFDFRQRRKCLMKVVSDFRDSNPRIRFQLCLTRALFSPRCRIDDGKSGDPLPRASGLL